MSSSIGTRHSLILVASSLLVVSSAPADEGDPLGTGITAFDQGGPQTDIASAVVVDSAGAVYLFGTATTGASSHSMVIARFLPNGQPDTGFAPQGEIVNPFGLANSSWGVDMQLLPSGRLLLGGTVDFGSGNHSFFMGVLEPSGIPYELFGVSGKGYTYETFPGGDSTDDLGAIVADRFGRVVAVGTVDIDTGDTDIGVARLTSSGIWDDSFDGNGNTTVAFSDGPDQGLAVAIDGQDRIVLGGAAWTTGTGNDHDWAIAVLDSSGGLDNSFDGNGRWVGTGDFGGTDHDFIRDLAVWPDGTIVAAGDAEVDSDRARWVVLSLPSSGGSAAIQTGTFCGTSISPCTNGPQDSARSLLLQGDGKIVIGGHGRGLDGTLDFGAARLQRNLSLDASFAGDGTTSYDFTYGSGGGADTGTAVAFDRDGRIVVGGAIEFNGLDTDFGWVRLDSAYVFADGFDWPGGTVRWSTTAP